MQLIIHRKKRTRRTSIPRIVHPDKHQGKKYRWRHRRATTPSFGSIGSLSRGQFRVLRSFNIIETNPTGL